jgi:holo-[acyl-carrier protein] synthase
MELPSGGTQLFPRNLPFVSEFTLVVGVDLIRVSDVTDSIARFGERYVQRVFTAEEIGYCQGDPASASARFAARFAAKEATMKVLRVRNTDSIDWRLIEVRRSPAGWCDIVLRDAADAIARREGISGLALSMSHEQEYAMATVVGQRAVGPSQ